MTRRPVPLHSVQKELQGRGADQSQHHVGQQYEKCGGNRGVNLSASTERIAAFLFQAEDGIRDTSVTAVHTCALPICAYMPGFTLSSDRPTSVMDSRPLG